MTLLLVYLFLTIPKLATAIGIISGVTLGLFLVCWFVMSVDSYKPVKPKFWILYASVVGLLFSVVLPNKTDSYVLAGVYATQLAVESEVGQDVLKIVKDKIKESINEGEKK